MKIVSISLLVQRLLFFICMLFSMVPYESFSQFKDNQNQSPCTHYSGFNYFLDNALGMTELEALEKARNMPLIKKSHTINYGHTLRSVWVYLKVDKIKNIDLDKSECIFDLANPLLDEIIFYFVHKKDINKVTTMGDKHDFSNRFLAPRTYAIPFSVLAANKYVTQQEYLFKVSNTSTMVIPLKIKDTYKYWYKILLDYIILGLFYGMFATFIYTGWTNYSVYKNAGHLLYSLYAFFMMIFFMSRDGIVTQFLLQNSGPWKLQIPRFFISAAMLSGIYYYLKFFKTYSKWISNAIKIYITINLIYCSIIFFLDSSETYIPTYFIVLSAPILMILLSLYT